MFLATIDEIAGLIPKIAHRKSDFKFNNIGPFPLRACKRAFFVFFIDLSMLKIEASAKQSKKNQYNKQRKIFSTLVVETGLIYTYIFCF